MSQVLLENQNASVRSGKKRDIKGETALSRIIEAAKYNIRKAQLDPARQGLLANLFQDALQQDDLGSMSLAIIEDGVTKTLESKSDFGVNEVFSVEERLIEQLFTMQQPATPFFFVQVNPVAKKEFRDALWAPTHEIKRKVSTGEVVVCSETAFLCSITVQKALNDGLGKSELEQLVVEVHEETGLDISGLVNASNIPMGELSERLSETNRPAVTLVADLDLIRRRIKSIQHNRDVESLVVQLAIYQCSSALIAAIMNLSTITPQRVDNIKRRTKAPKTRGRPGNINPKTKTASILNAALVERRDAVIRDMARKHPANFVIDLALELLESVGPKWQEREKKGKSIEIDVLIRYIWDRYKRELVDRNCYRNPINQ